MRSPERAATDEAVAPESPARWRRLRWRVLVAAATAAVLVVSFVALVPRGVELASLRAGAGDHDGARKILEAEVAQGDASASTAVALAREHIETGNFDVAKRMLVPLRQRRPRDAEVWKAFELLHRRSPDSGELLGVLSALQDLEFSAPRQREIVSLWAQRGDEVRHREALDRLVARDDAAEVADHLLAARLHAQAGEHARALATLDRMVALHPATLDASVAAAQVSALASTGHVASAVRRAQTYLDGDRAARVPHAPMLAAALGVAGHPRAAAVLLEPYMHDRASVTPALLHAWCQAMVDAGRSAKALARLDEFAPIVKRSGDLLRMRIELAISEGKSEVAWDATEAIAAGDVAPSTMVRLMTIALNGLNAGPPVRTGQGHGGPAAPAGSEAALDPERPWMVGRLRALWHRHGARIAADDPVLATRLALAIEDATRLVNAEGATRFVNAEGATRFVNTEGATQVANAKADKRQASASRPASVQLPSPSPPPAPQPRTHDELRALALEDPARWLFDYADVATRAGHTEQLAATWLEIARNEAAPADLRVQIAYRLLESGDKVRGEQAFRALAQASAPDEEATQRLLFLWGPRPARDRLDWLEARAKAARGAAERARWMRLLVDRGGAARAWALYLDTGSAMQADAAVVDAAVAALSTNDAAAALKDAARRVRSPDALIALSQREPATSRPALEQRLLEAALAAGAEGATLLRRAAFAALRAGHADAALAHFATYFELGGERAARDAEALQPLGDLRWLRGDVALARAAYARAVAAGAAGGSFEARRGTAVMLHRLERRAEALELYDALLRERPGDRHLRADLVALLLEMGRLQAAHRTLEMS